MMLFLALAASAPADAEAFQPTAALDSLVAQFTGKEIGELGGARTPVDTRLKLASCAAPQLAWRNDARDAVVVRCMAPAWRIFVPVNALPRPKPVASAPAAAAPAAPVVKPQPVIKRGDGVVVEAGAAGFSISRRGVAVNDAVPGARLGVRFEEKKPPVQAIAVEPGRARLPGWDE